MVKILSLILSLGMLACPSAQDEKCDISFLQTDEKPQKITVQAPPLCGENFTVMEETEGGVPTRFGDKDVKTRTKCPHKSKDIKDCDRNGAFNLPKRENGEVTKIKISVQKWEIEITPDGYGLSTLDEPPTVTK